MCLWLVDPKISWPNQQRNLWLYTWPAIDLVVLLKVSSKKLDMQVEDCWLITSDYWNAPNKVDDYNFNTTQASPSMNIKGLGSNMLDKRRPRCTIHTLITTSATELDLYRSSLSFLLKSPKSTTHCQMSNSSPEDKHNSWYKWRPTIHQPATLKIT